MPSDDFSCYFHSIFPEMEGETVNNGRELRSRSFQKRGDDSGCGKGSGTRPGDGKAVRAHAVVGEAEG